MGGRASFPAGPAPETRPLSRSIGAAAPRDPIHVLAGLDPTQALTRYFFEVGVVFLQPPQMFANAAISLLESKSVRFRTRLLKLQVA